MNEHIDHAAEAVRCADIAAHSYGQMDTRNGDMAVAQQIEAQTQAQVAQVHATLALVEQQRIANIIALSQVRTYDGPPPLRHLATRPAGEFDIEPLPEIAEALGIQQNRNNS